MSAPSLLSLGSQHLHLGMDHCTMVLPSLVTVVRMKSTTPSRFHFKIQTDSGIPPTDTLAPSWLSSARATHRCQASSHDPLRSIWTNVRAFCTSETRKGCWKGVHRWNKYVHPWWTQAGSSWAVSKDMVHRTRQKKRKEKECKTSRPETDGSSKQGKWLALPAHARKKRSSRNRRRGGPLRLPFRLLATSKKPESSAARKYKERTDLSFGSQIWCSKLASMKVTREEALKLCQLHDQIEALLHKHVAYENRHQSPRMENHVKEEKQSLQEKQRKKILWTRNISEANVAKLKRLCRKEGVKFVEEFDEEVTHLVTAEARGLCKTRSMKYLMGVMHGCWVLSEQWVEDSAGDGAFREEEAYEIRGDPYAAGAPRKSRTNSGCRKIFDGYFFHIAARKIAIQNETIAHIIRCIGLGGGQLLDRPLAPNEESGQKVGTKCIVLCEPKAPRAVLAALRRKWGVEPLSYCWVLNSISQFVAVPEAQIHKYYISG